MNYLCKLIDKMFKRRLSADGLEKAREFPRDPVLRDMRRYLGNPPYSYVHIEVDLAGASSFAPHRARDNFDVGCVESCSTPTKVVFDVESVESCSASTKGKD